METHKICSQETCEHAGEEQPIENFSPNGLRPDGSQKYLSMCKSCKCESNKKRYADPSTGYAAYIKHQNSLKPEYFRNYYRNRRETDPEFRERARRYVRESAQRRREWGI